MRPKTHVIALLTPLSSSAMYFICDWEVDFLPGGHGFIEVASLDDPRAKEVVGAVQAAFKKAAATWTPDALKRLESQDRQHSPKVLLAPASDLLDSVQKLKAKGPDEPALTELRHELLSAMEAVAASDPAEFEDPDGRHLLSSAKLQAIGLLGEWRDANASYMLAIK